jgi:hypothetical protein
MSTAVLMVVSSRPEVLLKLPWHLLRSRILPRGSCPQGLSTCLYDEIDDIADVRMDLERRTSFDGKKPENDLLYKKARPKSQALEKWKSRVIDFGK